MSLTLILGGARSGKSDFALQLARDSARAVAFIATMDPADDELRARVARHRSERPADWRTVEEPNALLDALSKHASPNTFVVVDCMTLWISNLLLAALPSDEEMPPDATNGAIATAVAQAEALASWCAAFGGDIVVVSNEVGSGVVPAYALGRAFRDALGAANRIVAARADAVYHVVAGLAVDLKSKGAISVAPRGIVQS